LRETLISNSEFEFDPWQLPAVAEICFAVFLFLTLAWHLAPYRISARLGAMENDPALTRCQELWFPDGTVVLRAGNVHFRTYIGALAGASTVFRDMFALPQSTVADGQEVYEGLPFVRLVDTASDVMQLLRSLHQLGCVPFDFPCVSAHSCLSYLETALRERFSVVAAALRMGTKYDIPYLRQAAISKLDALCPSTLATLRNYKHGNQVISNYIPNLHIAMTYSQRSATLCTSCQPAFGLWVLHLPPRWISSVQAPCLWTTVDASTT
jgi:hypothetical protein